MSWVGFDDGLGELSGQLAGHLPVGFSDCLPILSIFPNPAQNTLWINLPTERSATISLITLTGSVVREYSCAGGETQLSLSDLPNGIYLCRIQTQEGVLRTEKIVVQR